MELSKQEMKKIFLIKDDIIIDKLLKISEKIFFPKNQMILNIGEKQNFLYIILSGITRSFYLDIDGNDVTKLFMSEKDFCVGESLFEEDNSILGVEALEDVQALKINAKKLKQIILENRELTQIYIQYLEKNLIYKMKRESSFQLMSATERYINFHRNHKNIENRVNQSYIASYLGIAPESLSRIKRTIKEEI